MTVRSYATARAFRSALEARLKQIADTEQTDIQRLRRQVAFDRLLARLFQSDEIIWVLKGGYAMELRMENARATKDIDLTVANPEHFARIEGSYNDGIREQLQDQLSLEMGDYFTFLIGLPMMELDAAPYGGARFPVDVKMDGRTFVKFHLDVGVGDVVAQPVEWRESRDWLEFAGVAPLWVALLSKEQQFAEKVHAYTLPNRGRANSRVKDLVDMVMLVQQGDMDPQRVNQSLELTFARRKTHEIPTQLDPPPDSWQPVFDRLAASCQLTSNIDKSFKQLLDYMNRLLAEVGED